MDDDTLEIPRPPADDIHQGDDHSSGDEDAGLDWTKLPKPGAAARPVIPKRGEKDFEPSQGGGSGLQLHILDRSRDAMLAALRINRTTSSKTISYGIWYPSIDRVHVTTARGIHFSTMGLSVSRTAQHEDIDERSRSKLPKRLELLPEEALYLIERGALFCYKSVVAQAPLIDPSNHETKSPGAPMSVQQAFAEMIGREDMTLERYQVYAYLKRLGFILTRAEPPSPEYPTAPPFSSVATQPQTLIRRLADLFSLVVSNIIGSSRLFHKVDWSKRICLRRHKTTHGIFRALRFIPCGHAIPIHRPPLESEVHLKSSPPSPYKIFFHVYKPSTPFRKTVPPAPDFHVVVVDARTTAMPSLQELTTLFDKLPEMPLPPPRKRNVPTPATQAGIGEPSPTSLPSEASPRRTSTWTSFWTFLRRLFAPLPFVRGSPPPQKAKPTYTPPKPNPFLALKTGKKTVVIAVVDSGNISFFRFGQGVFEEWPMM